MPDHVVPENFLIRVLVPVAGEQSSIITIFALWNTMMGTSILSMPWAIKQAGYVCGIAMLILMAAINGYTSYRVLRSVDFFLGKKISEFSDVCKHFLGKYAEITAVFCSLLTLLGGMIVYWILLSSFLFHIVNFLYMHIQHSVIDNLLPSSGNSSAVFTDVVCEVSENASSLNTSQTSPLYNEVWNQGKTVPFFLLIILVPLLNFKSPTFFTKFNSLGTISVLYLMIFVTVKASHWRFHLQLGTSTQYRDDDPDYVPMFKWTFPALTGISALAYFIQNSVLAITRNQRNPQNSPRDLVIAYALVAFTYVYVGVMFFTAFPLSKTCIKDNLLNNIAPNDIMAFVAQIGLFIQMLCVFPLLAYILRAQLMHTVFGSSWPSLRHVLILNVTLVAICLVFTLFLPHIGHILSFLGAFCGLVYAIALPCIVYIVASRQEGTLTWTKLIFHILLMAVSVANFIAQFIILGADSS
ncbi:sodium-coupled neutral amino acid transporter 9-like isoform X2 [Pomacea canaliculata]|nr:sodium-coupled neutral amino acid transporter 9-like isoform X2 [Pomacea canaliculata]XP_025110975.1 sodium-coupled neutral amino acid transporter 9-like isoform X2 [Pomacea canaliculata]